MANFENHVSVYIPTYNRSELLRRAVQSVLDQTYAFVQVVVCSDNSSDDTDSVMADFIRNYSNIIYIKNYENRGACYTRNRALSYCDGKYVTGLDDDDYFEKDRVEKFVAAVKTTNNNLLFSGFKYLDGIKKRHVYKSTTLVSHEELLVRNKIGSQVFTLKEYVISVGGYDEKLPAWQDYDLWLRLTKTYGPALPVMNTSYIVDVSHPWERISVKSSKIEKAYSCFLKKYDNYNVPKFRASLLRSKLEYKSVKAEISELVYILISGGWSDKISLAKLMIKRVVNR